jgi:hypothetical protein
VLEEFGSPFRTPKPGHKKAAGPLIESHIPVWSKNSFAPEKPGTKIVPRISVSNGARAVTSMTRVALISLEPAHATLPGAHVMARAPHGARVLRPSGSVWSCLYKRRERVAGRDAQKPAPIKAAATNPPAAQPHLCLEATMPMELPAVRNAGNG